MAKRDKPKWTIMVCLAGENNLTTNCISVLQQSKFEDNPPPPRLGP